MNLVKSSLGMALAIMMSAGAAHAQPGDMPEPPRPPDAPRAERDGGDRGPSPEELRRFIEQEREGMERRIRAFIESRSGESRDGARAEARAEGRRERRVEVRAFAPDGPGVGGERPQRLTMRGEAGPREEREEREVRVFIDRGNGPEEISPRRLQGEGPPERRGQARREIRIERFGDEGPRLYVFEHRGEHRDGPAWGPRADPRRTPVRIEMRHEGFDLREDHGGRDGPRVHIERRFGPRAEGMGHGMRRGGEHHMGPGDGPGPRVFIERFEGGPRQLERLAPSEGEPRVREFRFGPFEGRMELRRLDVPPRADERGGPDAPRGMGPGGGEQRREFRIERSPRGEGPVMLLERITSRRAAGDWDRPV